MIFLLKNCKVLGAIRSGEQLREQVNMLIKGAVQDIEKNIYYADLEAFYTIEGLIDYDRLLWSEKY